MRKAFGQYGLSMSAALAAATVVASLSVSYLANGQVFGTVGMPVLRGYGGTTFADLANMEIWRLATAQLVHAKPAHMLFNAICLFLIGNLVESRVGAVRTLMIWLIAGGIATAVSPILVEAPWNVGTGASQATFAFAGCATVLALLGALNRQPACILAALVVVPGLALDLVHGGYPKPGHVAGFGLGMIFGGIYLRAAIVPPRQGDAAR